MLNEVFFIQSGLLRQQNLQQNKWINTLPANQVAGEEKLNALYGNFLGAGLWNQLQRLLYCVICDGKILNSFFIINFTDFETFFFPFLILINSDQIQTRQGNTTSIHWKCWTWAFDLPVASQKTKRNCDFFSMVMIHCNPIQHSIFLRGLMVLHGFDAATWLGLEIESFWGKKEQVVRAGEGTVEEWSMECVDVPEQHLVGFF